MNKSLRVAVVHDWLVGMRGGENVLEAILEMFPNAEIYTLIYSPHKVSSEIRKFKIHTSFLQWIPNIEKYYRYFLPVMPIAIQLFDLRHFDLIVSSSHCVAKGVRKRRGAVHVSYVHSPMRYVWDRFDDYFGKDKASTKVRIAAHLLRPFLKFWDRQVSQFRNVNSLIANSRFIADQIKRAYGRSAQVVYPFTDVSRFEAQRLESAGKSHIQNENMSNPSLYKNSEPYYLVVSAFAPNKRVDLAIEACMRLGRRLKVVGSGQDEAALRAIAAQAAVQTPVQRASQSLVDQNTVSKSNQIEFLGNLSDREVTDLYLGCRAFLFPGVDDFGITPIEAMAAGRPVIAFAGGGALETVTPHTGVFFNEPTSDSLMLAIQKFELSQSQFDPAKCRDRASLFNKTRFKNELSSEIQMACKNAAFKFIPQN